MASLLCKFIALVLWSFAALNRLNHTLKYTGECTALFSVNEIRYAICFTIQGAAFGTESSIHSRDVLEVTGNIRLVPNVTENIRLIPNVTEKIRLVPNVTTYGPD